MSPPEMAGWNLALRFALELTTVVGLGAGAWSSAAGAGRWVAVIVIPMAAAAIWGVFNVPGDPSRSGAAPVEVPGWVRLGIELLILGAGVLAFAIASHRDFAIGLAALIVLHYAVSWNRIYWLLGR